LLTAPYRFRSVALIEQRVERFKDKLFVFRFNRLLHFVLLSSSAWTPSQAKAKAVPRQGHSDPIVDFISRLLGIDHWPDGDCSRLTANQKETESLLVCRQPHSDIEKAAKRNHRE
jgi:hypothetical protein